MPTDFDETLHNSFNGPLRQTSDFQPRDRDVDCARSVFFLKLIKEGFMQHKIFMIILTGVLGGLFSLAGVTESIGGPVKSRQKLAIDDEGACNEAGHCWERGECLECITLDVSPSSTGTDTEAHTTERDGTGASSVSHHGGGGNGGDNYDENSRENLESDCGSVLAHMKRSFEFCPDGTTKPSTAACENFADCVSGGRNADLCIGQALCECFLEAATQERADNRAEQHSEEVYYSTSIKKMAADILRGAGLMNDQMHNEILNTVRGQAREDADADYETPYQDMATLCQMKADDWYSETVDYMENRASDSGSSSSSNSQQNTTRRPIRSR